MKSRLLIVASILLLAVVSSGFKQDKKDRFYKGNMHAHSYWSDGDTYPENVARWYRDHGYQFLVVTDHNTLQEGKKIKNINGDSVQLRELSAYRQEFEKKGEFLLISGEEITDKAEKKPVHLNGINLSKRVKPCGGETVTECIVADVQAIKKALAGTETPEWITVNHPNFGWALTDENLARNGSRFFEVFNGHPSVHNYGDSARPSTETMWDRANKWRIDHQQLLLYGTASDDTHNYEQFEVGKANPGRGWVMVRARELTPVALYQAMYSGDFYASTGVELLNFSSTKKRMKIQIRGEKNVQYTTEYIGWLAGQDHPEVVKTVTGTSSVYQFTGKELFVRARIISNKQKTNPFANGDVEMAWLQPVVIKK